MTHIFPIGIRVLGTDEVFDAIRNDDTISLPKPAVLELDIIAICRLALRVVWFVFMDIVRYTNEHTSILHRLAWVSVAVRAWSGLPLGTCRDGHGSSIDSCEK